MFFCIERFDILSPSLARESAAPLMYVACFLSVFNVSKVEITIFASLSPLCHSWVEKNAWKKWIIHQLSPSKSNFVETKKKSINDKPQKPRQTHEFDSRLELMRFFVWFLSFYRELAEIQLIAIWLCESNFNHAGNWMILNFYQRWNLNTFNHTITICGAVMKPKMKIALAFFNPAAKNYKVKLAFFSSSWWTREFAYHVFSVPDRRLCVVVMNAIYPRERLMVRDELFIWRGFFFLETSAFFSAVADSRWFSCALHVHQ